MHFVFLTYIWEAVAEDVLLYHNAYRYLHRPALIFASCLVLVALLISVHLIFSHLRSYTKPAEQKWIVAVLLIVPIYATESILSLWNPRLSLVCDILRNCYEAFALYSFGSYLIACLGGERKVVELLEDESRKMLSERLLKEEGEVPKHPKAFYNFFRRPCLLGKDLLNIEKFGLVQYMILKTLCAFLAFILELFGVYGDGEFKWYYGYPYIAVVINFSQMWALYCLVQFYNVTHEMLRPIKPLAKFISFKSIVFATWWQGVGIALLCSFGVLPKEEKIQTGLQDFLICIEMSIAAVAHIFVFPAKPYRSVQQQQQHSDYRKITTTETTKEPLKENEGGKSGILKKKETKVKCPGTSVKESIQDIVVGGGQHVVKDVVLTINQAIEPVEKGVTKIQETFHKKKKVTAPKDDKKQDMKVEEHVDQKNSTLVSEKDDDKKHDKEVEEHVEKKKSTLVSEEDDGKKQDTEVEEHVEKKNTLVSEEDDDKKQDMEIEEHVEKKKSTLVSEEDDDKKQDMEIEEHVEQKKSILVSEEDDNKKHDMKVEEHVEQKKSTLVSEEEPEGISQSSSAAAVVKRFFFFYYC